MNPLQETFDLVLSFSRAVSLADVYTVLLKNCTPFGVQHVLAGIIPDRIIRPEEQPDYVVLGIWPHDWANRYFRKQYVRRDPTILHAATQTEPLVWSEIVYENQQPGARRVMDEARDFRLHDGITIPLDTIDGLRIGVSFSGDPIDKSPASVAKLTVLASYAVHRALEIRAMLRSGGVLLSARERECLLWVAEGKTTADIGTILDLSDKSIEHYLASARQKLNAINTAQALTQALRLGLL